ncbi:MAG TPA: hypothetical protein VK363_05180 [Pyrinomonadaceae bacterium]|nr:hypothetical protein [Pyrinomonadaceae bacterium]
MKIADLSPEIADKLERCLYDQLINKHEGPETWGILEDYEFLKIGDFDVLLPIEKQHHPNIAFVKIIFSENKETLTLFFRDTTYKTGLFSERVAVCIKFEDENFLIAVLYHECFIIEAGQTQIVD